MTDEGLDTGLHTPIYSSKLPITVNILITSRFCNSFCVETKAATELVFQTIHQTEWDN